jgi:hypothetical protein
VAKRDSAAAGQAATQARKIIIIPSSHALLPFPPHTIPQHTVVMDHARDPCLTGPFLARFLRTYEDGQNFFLTLRYALRPLPPLPPSPPYLHTQVAPFSSLPSPPYLSVWQEVCWPKEAFLALMAQNGKGAGKQVWVEVVVGYGWR